jgi:hypothetical protein
MEPVETYLFEYQLDEASGGDLYKLPILVCLDPEVEETLADWISNHILYPQVAVLDATEGAILAVRTDSITTFSLTPMDGEV